MVITFACLAFLTTNRVMVIILACLAFLAIVTIAACARWLRQKRVYDIRNTFYQKAAADGEEYRVHRRHRDPAAAANTLSQLNDRTLRLLRHLRDRYVRAPTGPADAERVAATRRLLARYNPDNLIENSPLDPSGGTSYVIEKGSLLALCLREKDPSLGGDPLAHDIHPLNTLTFVLLHELAHIAVIDQQHPPIFWSAFKFLLAEAARIGEYAPQDYEAEPIEYCGLLIEYSPLFDEMTPVL